MPASEAHLDAPGPLLRLLRLRFEGYTGHLGGPDGVDFVQGVAQNGVSQRVASRLAGIFGRALEILGPWEAPKPKPPPPARPRR